MAQEERQEVKTASEFAQAINWFTQEIETLAAAVSHAGTGSSKISGAASRYR
jgi:mevalonate kinase